MPPARLYFVFLRVLLYSFGTSMAVILTDKAGTGESIHLYTWLAVALSASAAAVMEAALAWPKSET